MCGIAGKFNFTGQPVNKADVDKMLDTMTYRGPDDRGVFVNDNVGLGHLRLSIIDLSPLGHQPMISKDGNLVIVYNGEVYNYLEIRQELENRGRSFISKTDTEVILQSYEEWGEDCVQRFNGMWSFVIYDRCRKILFASRDRFGVKPFHYHINKDRIIFGSEIKALLADDGSLKKINRTFLYNFIDRNIPHGNDETVFGDVKTLLAGHNLTIDYNGRFVLKPHWRLDVSHIKQSYDYENKEQELRRLLVDAVRLRLRSDVPVGVCLSGGIDSSLITCIITKLFGQNVKTFSSVYNESGYSEAEFIDCVNNFCNTEPHLITATAENFDEILNQIIRHHDEPVRMPSTYSQWHVMKVAKNNATVLLDGQGADELLAGYIDYYPYYLSSLLRDAIGLRRPLYNFKKFINDRKEIVDFYGQRFGRDITKIVFPGLLTIKRKIKPSGVWHDHVLSDEFRQGVQRYSNDYPRLFSDPLTQELFRSFFGTNLPMVLKFEDRISMAFSLESRTPFLDYRVVEFCFGLEYQEKYNGVITKAVLRKSFKDILPEKIYNRKDKKGFPTPNEHWFRNELKDYLKNMFSQDSIRRHGIFNPQAVALLYKDHLNGNNNSRLLWRILSTELWMKQYFG